MSDRLDRVRAAYRAYETGDRAAIERVLSRDMVFSSGPDPELDWDGYFERCWPNTGHIDAFEFVRLQELPGDEVLVTYEATRVDGTRFRNTEILTFDGDKIRRQEVYFGWDL